MSQQTIFSEREKQVLALLFEGKSNKQIALALGVSTRTVEFHLANIYARLQVHSRSEAILSLSKSRLWESTGDELGESTVEVKGDLLQNEGKSSTSNWRPPMKPLLYAGTALIAVVLIVFFSLVNSGGSQTGGAPTALPQTTSPFSTTLPGAVSPGAAPTLTPRERIVAEERQLVAEYDQAVKAEIQKGPVETRQDPTSGKEIIRFEGDSYVTLAKLYDELNQQLQALNKQFMALYIADVQPTPFPTQPTEKENEDYYQELLAQYPAFFDQLLAEGPTVMIYDPNEGIYYKRVIGDTYAKSEIMTAAMESLRQAPQVAKVDQEAQVTQVRKSMGDPGLQLTFQGVQNLANAPWISAAVYTDAMGTKYWVAIDADRLAGIEPASRVEVPAVEVKSSDVVRPLAEQFAAANSPRFAQLKAELLYEEGSKGDLYFFTWSTRNKDWSGTDWAMMSPFLQIGLSADGKIATYIDTLDLYP